MASESCARFEGETAAFVLGDVPAELRADMVAHLRTCTGCRREVATMAAALDAISSATAAVEPSAGFLASVLAGADAAGLVAADPAPQPVPAGPATAGRRPGRPGAVVVRRRRTLGALTGATAVLAVTAMAFHTWLLLGPAVVAAALDVAYLAMVVTVTHTRARADLAGAFAPRPGADDSFWSALERDLTPLDRSGADGPEPVVTVRNAALARFAVSYFLGWLLTPLVGAIRVMRGDLTGIERSPLLARIVVLQQRGRAQSIKLLVAGATTVAVAGGGAATVLVAPGPAMAAPAAAVRTYTVHPGDTLAAIAAAHGTTTAYLAHINGIADAAALGPGDVLQLPLAPLRPPSPGPPVPPAG